MPASPGLLLVDCRVGGAISTAPVLLLGDAAVAAELQAFAQEQRWLPEELDELVYDLGLWVDYVGQVTSSAACATGESKSTAGPGALPWTAALDHHMYMKGVGATLLQYALEQGWMHTARWLMRDLQALGVQPGELAPGKLLTHGSPSLLRAALASRQPAVALQALMWSLMPYVPQRLVQAIAHHNLPNGADGVVKHQPSMLRALWQAMVLWGSTEEEAAFRSYADAWIAAQSRVVLMFNTAMFICVMASRGRNALVLDAGSLPPLVYLSPSIIVVLACALAPPRVRTRLLAMSAMLQHLGTIASYLLLNIGVQPAPAVQSYMLGIGVVASEGVLLPAAALLSPVAAAIVSPAKLPLQAGLYLRACQLQGLACAGSPRWALLRHACVTLLGVATTLMCHTYLRWRFMHQCKRKAPKPHKE